MGKCPMLEECEEEVDELTAEHVCYGAWHSCKHTQHLLHKKKPREWVEFQDNLKS